MSDEPVILKIRQEEYDRLCAAVFEADRLRKQLADVLEAQQQLKAELTIAVEESAASETPRFTPAHRETLRQFAAYEKVRFAGQKDAATAVVSALAEIDRLTTLNETLHLEIMKLRNRGVAR